MIPLLAQAEQAAAAVQPLSFGQLGVVSIAVVVIGGALLTYHRLADRFTGRGEKREITPQPLVVTEQPHYAGKGEHDALVERVASLESRIEERFREAAIASSQSRGKLYDELRVQGKEIAGVKKEAETLTRQTLILDQKIDQLLLRTRARP
ncbi:MAG: hypothetical protein LBC18_03255 [Opitutaceae bacterium]|jgi:hypothetical protein|nr:hypothetical protein [Opitutaceae bacterium]